MLDEKIIADNIRAERNRASITMDDITKELNISRTTYIEYEKDAKSVKTSTLLKLAELFNCDIADFFKKRKLTKR